MQRFQSAGGIKATVFIFFFILITDQKMISPRQELIEVQGWNAYVHLPDDYDRTTKNYPTIIFTTGAGEVGTDPQKLLQNGPNAYIEQGWNGDAMGVKFIVIGLQRSTAWNGGVQAIKDRVDELKKRYRIGDLTITGLSLGGLYSIWYAQEYPNNLSRFVTVCAMERIRSTDDHSLDPFAEKGGKSLVVEQKNDRRRGQNITAVMNAAKPESSFFVLTNFGGGGHCCWNQFYGGQGNEPQRLEIGGRSLNLYEWIASEVLTVLPEFIKSVFVVGNKISWQCENIQPGDFFLIEESTDGLQFHTIGTLKATPNQNSYNFKK